MPKPRLLSPRRKAASTRLSSLTNRAALTLSTRHPSLALDNNAAERSLRRVAMGRANFFFVGHEASGHRHAVLYTLINSCQQHGRNPVDYLTDVLTRIKAYPARDIIDLLPHRWRPPDDPAPPIPPSDAQRRDFSSVPSMLGQLRRCAPTTITDLRDHDAAILVTTMPGMRTLLNVPIAPVFTDLRDRDHLRQLVILGEGLELQCDASIAVAAFTLASGAGR